MGFPFVQMSCSDASDFSILLQHHKKIIYGLFKIIFFSFNITLNIPRDVFGANVGFSGHEQTVTITQQK